MVTVCLKSGVVLRVNVDSKEFCKALSDSGDSERVFNGITSDGPPPFFISKTAIEAAFESNIVEVLK